MSSKPCPAPPQPLADPRPGHARALRLHLIKRLQQRADTLQGEARQLLEAKLARLAHAGTVAPAVADDSAPLALPSASDGASGLSALLAHIVASKPGSDAPATVPPPSLGAAPGAADTLPELEQFRDLWAAIRSEIQMRQSMEQAPEDAGPLNSIVLVHRSLMRMRELSPGYLQHFLGYLDNLVGLEQLQSAGVLASSAVQRSNVGAKPARPRARKRTA